MTSSFTFLTPQDTKRLRKASDALGAGNHRAAEQLCRQVLADNPDHPNALTIYAMARANDGDMAGAERALVKALANLPPTPSMAMAEALRALANLQAVQGRFAEAAANFHRILPITPADPDLWFRLGGSLYESGKPAEAAAFLQRALELDPRNARFAFVFGCALSMAGLHADAVKAFGTAIGLQPTFVDAFNNMAVAQTRLGQHREAIATLERAAAAVPDAPLTYFNLGDIHEYMGDSDQARAAFEKAVTLKPDYLAAHDRLMKCRFAAGEQGQVLDHFPKSIQAMPQSQELRLTYAGALIRLEKLEEAEEVLNGLRAGFPPSPGVEATVAGLRMSQKRYDDSVRGFEAAAKFAPDQPDLLTYWARALLAAGDNRAALARLERAVAVSPHNQFALAYLAIARRLVDGDEGPLCDYGTLVKEYALPVPPGYANTEEFNEALDDILTGYHTAQQQPFDQTLRGGTQTRGVLFDIDAAAVRALKQAIEGAVADYIKTMPADAAHPLTRLRRPQFDFAGSWSCRLQSAGFHTNHIHTMGWISSAYYVALPPAVSRLDQEGWIKFGEPDLDVLALSPRKVIKPEVGKLVLFPSYMFHGTVPFTDPEHRTTVAFDVVPVG